LTFVLTKFQANKVNVIVPKVLPCTKSDPQMYKTVENSNKDHNHVRINSSDKNGCCTFPQGIVHMQRDPAVALSSRQHAHSNAVVEPRSMSLTAATAILDFYFFHFYRSERSRVQNYVIMPNFIEIARTDFEISQFLNYSKLRLPLSWILIFF